MRGNLVEKALVGLLAAEILFACYAVVYLYVYGCLPPPFFYVSSDTFSDYFYPNYWADMDGRYEQWGSIYPIAVFAFAKLVRSPACDAVTSVWELRACDLYSVWYLIGAFVLGAGVSGHKMVAYSAGAINWSSPRGKWAGTLVVLFSLPGLFALERGNYIILAMLFVALAAPIERRWHSALFLALAINVKQYLLVLLAIPVMKRDLRYVAMTLVFVCLINGLAMTFVQESRYSLLFQNMLDFSSGSNFESYYFERIWNSTSLVPWYRAIQNSLAVANIRTGEEIKSITDLLAAAILVLRLLTLGVLALLWIQRDQLSSNFIAIVLITCMMANTDILGGYGSILCFPFLLSIWERERRLWYLGLVLMMYVPLEFPLGPGRAPAAPSFLGVLDGAPDMRMTLGAMVRPLVTSAFVGLTFFDLMACTAKTPVDAKVRRDR